MSLVACNDGPRPDAETAGASASGASQGSGTPTGGQSTGGGADDDDGPSGTEGESDENQSESGDEPLLDVGHDSASESDSSEPGGDECTNADILFVIDDSGSMADNQDQLIASFPGFVFGIREQLAFADSYHIGVTTTSQYTLNPPACYDHGDLVTQTVSGPESSNAVCSPFSSGSSYIDETEPDLDAKFGCIAKVGGGGDDDEKPIRSVLRALGPGTNQAGGCNEGFSRLDSLLVVVIITDEDDVLEECAPDEFPCFPGGTEGTPQEWHDQVIALKGGHAENVVVLSILGTQLDNSCGATPASRVMSFTNNFGANGHIGDVCAPSYDQFFVDVLPIIDQACEDYVEPEG